MICRQCKVDKEASCFEVFRMNGKDYQRKTCKDCKYGKQKERRVGIRDYILRYKANLGCCHCGYSDPRALQFHHVDDDKEINVGDAVKRGWSIERIQTEINKCAVLCANCHMIAHHPSG